MACNKVQEQLLAYLARALSPEERSQVEVHLASCPACQAELAEWQALDIALGDPELKELVLHEPPPLPADFTEQVLARVEAEKPQGVAVLWPWLRQRWSGRQYASAAYAMTASVTIMSASTVISAWEAGSRQLDLWSIRMQAYTEGAQLVVGAYWTQIQEILSLVKF